MFPGLRLVGFSADTYRGLYVPPDVCFDPSLFSVNFFFFSGLFHLLFILLIFHGWVAVFTEVDMSMTTNSLFAGLPNALGRRYLQTFNSFLRIDFVWHRIRYGS